MNYLYHNLSIDQLEDRVNGMSIAADEEKMRMFAFFSANLFHFMPTIEWKDHEPTFRQVCLHQHLSWRDLHDRELKENILITGIDRCYMKNTITNPGIICTYHLGSYRLINRILKDEGVPFSLVVNSRVFEEEMSHQVLGKIDEEFFTRTFDLIDAEEPTALLKMIRAVKAGRNLVVYVDGNTGATDNVQNQIPVNFMQGKLSVRKGIAVLADILKCPIYPVSSLRLSLDHVHFNTGDPILPPEGKRSCSFVKATMQRLYAYLETELMNHPFQWECWLYLHQHLILPKPVVSEKTVKLEKMMDPRLWGVFKIDGHCFALHKPSFLSFKISEYFFEQVRKEDVCR